MGYKTLTKRCEKGHLYHLCLTIVGPYTGSNHNCTRIPTGPAQIGASDKVSLGFNCVRHGAAARVLASDLLEQCAAHQRILPESTNQVFGHPVPGIGTLIG